MNTDQCTVCGCAETKLIEGYYYCVECNTQNINVQETIIESKSLADGTFGMTTKKVVKVQKKTVTMSGEWHKWHAFNFIINGLADELVALGADPTFKMKLLWIWTRYIKKYQNKKELGLIEESLSEDNNAEDKNDDNDTINKNKKKYEKKISSLYKGPTIIDGSSRDIKSISKSLITAMLYLALNLDKSDIQLSTLYRFEREKRISIKKLAGKFVPEDINVKAIPFWFIFKGGPLCGPHHIRTLSMTLLKKLDLGTPVVPDLRKLVNNFLKELCLPDDIKPLVFSLMHFHSCKFFDTDDKYKEFMRRTPDYESYIMSFILLALKICFGLDDDYEYRLSDAVEKINKEKEYPKSYKFRNYSNSTDRLFSFREWCAYIQCRKIMLCKNCLYMSEQHCLDIDDYVHMEHMAERPPRKRKLGDEITLNLLNRIQVDNNIGVIPKEEFIPTLTPMSVYTEIIADHCQDKELKYLLSEDFTQYSLKYACEILELFDINTHENVVKGVNESKKVINNQDILGTIQRKVIRRRKYVYVKDCKNRNWMKTKPPTEEHITYVDSNQYEKGEGKSDNGSDSGYSLQYVTNENDVSNFTANHINISSDPNIKVSIEKDGNSADNEIFETDKILKEEDEDTNIFDDSFEYLDNKEERETTKEVDAGHEENEIPVQNDDDFSDSGSDMSCTSFSNFNPATFDRQSTIRELVFSTCKKYKIAIPNEYKIVKEDKRKDRYNPDPDKAPRPKKFIVNMTELAESKQVVQNLLSNYYQYMAGDLLSKLENEVRVAIQNVQVTENNYEDTNRTDVFERLEDIHNATDNLNGHTNIQENQEKEKTQYNETKNEIDDINELTLFEGEEMKLDELIPKSDPNFDENSYDINQLYAKINCKERDFTAKIDPEIENILLEKIKISENSAAFTHMTKNNKCDEFDSDDDIPLSVIKEEKEIAMKMNEQMRDHFEHLIKKEKLEFKYWFRHYDKTFIDCVMDLQTNFDEELKTNLPSTFYFVIKECSSILDCTMFNLYKNMQNLEKAIIIKSK